MPTNRTQRSNREPALSMLNLLRTALPYRGVTLNGKVVGCWYTSAPHASPRGHANGPSARISVVYRGLMRTADGRVTGVCGGIPLAPGFKARMLRMLVESTWDESFLDRKRGAHSFVDAVSDAAERVRCAARGMPDELDIQSMSSIGVRIAATSEDQARAASARFSSERALCISRFLDTLDPVMVAAIRPHRWTIPGAGETDPMIGVAWPLLDRTFDLGAPLQARVLAGIDDQTRLRRILRSHCYKVYSRIESTEGMLDTLRNVSSPSTLENEEPQREEVTSYGSLQPGSP